MSVPRKFVTSHPRRTHSGLLWLVILFSLVLGLLTACGDAGALPDEGRSQSLLDVQRDEDERDENEPDEHEHEISDIGDDRVRLHACGGKRGAQRDGRGRDGRDREARGVDEREQDEIEPDEDEPDENEGDENEGDENE